MLSIRRLLALCMFVLCVSCQLACAKDTLRILTWEGYVTAQDLLQVNQLLDKAGYDIEAKVIVPYANGAEQMFILMRQNKVDVSFLTLFFIQLQGGKYAKILQPVNTKSPRLSNYKYLLPGLTKIPMGMRGDQSLYIPFAGGSYGFYINRNRVTANEVPRSWNDLFNPRWAGKYSLNRSQVWYNVAIASMALGKPPFYINAMAEAGDHDGIKNESVAGAPLPKKLAELYENAGDYWVAAPRFLPTLDIVSSWGPEVQQANKAGGDWRIINFKEGALVWMDTINFVDGLKGRRLEAAEIVANYFIGKSVQSRVASELSLAAVSSLAATNPILKADSKFFSRGTFVPPYHVWADNVMTTMSNHAFAHSKKAKP